MKRRHKCFTLLEIGLCIAILSIVASLVGFQAKKMICAHRFHSNMECLMADVRRIQILSLSAFCDIELQITQSAHGYEYKLHTDEVLKHFKVKKKGEPLSGVDQILIDGKPLQGSCTFTLYGNGQVVPRRVVTFAYADETYLLDLTTPLLITLKRG